jgi:response regulator RpfG family c-di-GMP phosphodiesterase
MPEMLGTEFLSRTAEKYPDTIRIVLTAYTDVKDLVDAINSGKVFKYITKPWNQQQLQGVIQQAADTYRVLKQRTEELRHSLRRESLFNTITTAIRESLDYRSMLQTTSVPCEMPSAPMPASSIPSKAASKSPSRFLIKSVRMKAKTPVS